MHYKNNRPIISKAYIPYSRHKDAPTEDDYGTGDYLNPIFTHHIDKKDIEIVLEIGSRDAIDAIKLSDYYQTHVYAFECNPQAIKICEKNIDQNPNITLIPQACWNTTGDIPFYPVIGTRDPRQPLNIGASSCLEIDPDGIDQYNIQSACRVAALRLEDWMEGEGIEHIDLLCLDVQGATLQVLSGIGKYITGIKHIITEGYHKPGYQGEALAGEIAAYLNARGFQYKGSAGDELISNALFSRETTLTQTA